MTNHYHLIVDTPDANLSKGMRHLNGVYAQASNRRHHRVGYLFQGRFKGIVVDRDSIWPELRQQIYLGDDGFVKRTQRRLKVKGNELSIPRAQRRAPAPSVAAIASKCSDRNGALGKAYATGAYSYREIAERFEIHLATEGRVIRKQLLLMRDLTLFSLRLDRLAGECDELSKR